MKLVRQLATLILASRGDPELSPAEWRALLGLAVRERCAALAWVRAGALIERCAPSETAIAWRQIYITIAARGHVQMVAAAEAGGLLHRQGVHPITLKGFPLAAALYGDATARACTDIDWFVPREDRDVTRRVLASGGWSHNDVGLPWDETFSKSGSHGMLFLEVHSTLLHPRFQYLPVPAPEYELMLVEGVAVRRQVGSAMPAYLASHLAQHMSPPLLWDIDFATLWSRLSDLERLAARRSASDAGLARYLSWAERRAGRVQRLAEGEASEAAALGFTATGRRDIHPVWRHVWLAPSPAASIHALDCWVRPPWVRATYGPGIRGAFRRVAKHWRVAFAHDERVGDKAPGDGLPVTTEIARMDGARLLELARGVVGHGGEMWIVVTGNSMQPAIAEGDRVRIGQAGLLEPGMVVLADVAGRPILHRIREVRSDEVVLRGDALPTDDGPIPRASVIARVRASSRGAVIQELRTSLRAVGAGLT
jgi:hypothetical protein